MLIYLDGISACVLVGMIHDAQNKSYIKSKYSQDILNQLVEGLKNYEKE